MKWRGTADRWRGQPPLVSVVRHHQSASACLESYALDNELLVNAPLEMRAQMSKKLTDSSADVRIIIKVSGQRDCYRLSSELVRGQINSYLTPPARCIPLGAPAVTSPFNPRADVQIKGFMFP